MPLPHRQNSTAGKVARPALNTHLVGRDAWAWVAPARSHSIGSMRRVASSGSFNGATPMGSYRGAKWSNVAEAGEDFGVVQPLSSNTGVTILAVAAQVSDASLRQAWFSQRVGTPNFNQFGLLANTDRAAAHAIARLTLYTRNTAVTDAYVELSSQFDGLPHCWVMSNSTTSSSGTAFRDGVPQSITAQVAMSGTYVSTDQRVRVGNLGLYAGTGFAATSPVALIIAWPRQLPLALQQTLSENPRLAFRGPRRIWVPVAAGGAAITGPLIGSRHLATNGPLISGRLVA